VEEKKSTSLAQKFKNFTSKAQKPSDSKFD